MKKFRVNKTRSGYVKVKFTWEGWIQFRLFRQSIVVSFFVEAAAFNGEERELLFQ